MISIPPDIFYKIFPKILLSLFDIWLRWTWNDQIVDIK